MGVATILSAKKIYLLAWGEEKAQKVKECVEGPDVYKRQKIDLAFGIFLQILLHILPYLIDGNPLTLFPRFQMCIRDRM